MRAITVIAIFVCLLGGGVAEAARTGHGRGKRAEPVGKGRARLASKLERAQPVRPIEAKTLVPGPGPAKHGRHRQNRGGRARPEPFGYFVDAGQDDFAFDDASEDLSFGGGLRFAGQSEDLFAPEYEDSDQYGGPERALMKSGHRDIDADADAEGDAVEAIDVGAETTAHVDPGAFALDTITVHNSGGSLLRPRGGLAPQARTRRHVAQATGAGAEYNSEFMETLRRFQAALLQRPPPDISARWLPRVGERAHRVDKLVPKWKAVECATLDLRLRVVGAIYEGHRNQVMKLQDRASHDLFAYKTYGSEDEFYAELEMFMWLDHPLFIKAVCHRKEPDTGKLGILFEYIDGTSSMAFARSARPEQLRSISAQLLVALEHLHWLGIVHADLKPENVLVLPDGTIQVIDFGFAMHLPQFRRRRGTHTTMAPELHSLVPGRVHEGVDWWAYGSTLAMWYGFNDAYRTGDPGRYIAMDWRDFHYIAAPVPPKFPAELRSFLHIFFQAHPEARKINSVRLLRQLREQPFFDGFDWDSVPTVEQE